MGVRSLDLVAGYLVVGSVSLDIMCIARELGGNPDLLP